jgi:oxygen-dependent protoporphyrinogen oxidase
MNKKRVLILGAGVSGLSVAWHLEKKGGYDCVLLEKSPHLGGWMGSKEQQGFLLEQGPHLFKTSRSAHLLEVIEEIGFSSSILPSSSQAESRYVWMDGSFQKMPKSLLSFFTSSFCRPLLFSLWKEMRTPSYLQDETIWDFSCRRFGKTVTENFFDPVVSGIYAGSIKKLSIASCFPLLKQWEREKGSLLKGALFSKAKKKENSICKAPLFSFQEGTGSFIQQWASSLKLPIHCHEEVLSLDLENGQWIAKSHSNVWEADAVVVTTPSYAAASLLREKAPQSAEILQSFAYEDITTVYLGWKGDVLPFPAFGYLVPSKENLSLLGVLFDSSMFGRKDTLMTLMIRGIGHSEDALYKVVDMVCSSHLHISQKPSLFSHAEKRKAIPQYYLGHEEKKKHLFSHLAKEAPSLFLTGSYLSGVSISDCIFQGKQVVDAYF